MVKLMMRRRELIEVRKQNDGWKCEYRLGTQRLLFFVNKSFDKNKVIDLIAKKFNLTQAKVVKVLK